MSQQKHELDALSANLIGMAGVKRPLTERQKAEFSEDSVILRDYAVTYDSIY